MKYRAHIADVIHLLLVCAHSTLKNIGELVYQQVCVVAVGVIWGAVVVVEVISTPTRGSQLFHHEEGKLKRDKYTTTTYTRCLYAVCCLFYTREGVYIELQEAITEAIYYLNEKRGKNKCKAFIW